MMMVVLPQERRDDVTEALIYMRRATPDRFRRYTIVAENSVGIGRRDVELVQSKKEHSVTSKIVTCVVRFTVS